MPDFEPEDAAEEKPNSELLGKTVLLNSELLRPVTLWNKTARVLRHVGSKLLIVLQKECQGSFGFQKAR